MPLPPFYKFLDVNGAKLTLGNRNFKHAKPSTFNDVEDMTVQSLFPEPLEEALEKLEEGFVDAFIRNIDKQPSGNPATAAKIAALQKIFKAVPDMGEAIKRLLRQGDRLKVFDPEAMRATARDFLADINQFMQSYRVLCVTTKNDSDRMWIEYAQNHQGIVLRIEPNIEKESKYQLFRPVTYRERRPPFYEKTLDFLDGLFGDQGNRKRAILDTIIYSKTLDWEHESEYRLAVPLGFGEKDWNLMPYHPEEITEMYLGLAMSEDDKADIIDKAKAVNPAMKIFQASRGANNSLSFAPA